MAKNNSLTKFQNHIGETSKSDLGGIIKTDLPAFPEQPTILKNDTMVIFLAK